MSRVSRVPYHQNVYDLLGIEPSECAAARRMIEEHEAMHGPLPASIREWCLVRDAVIATAAEPVAERLRATLPLAEFLHEHTSFWRMLRVGRANGGEDGWWVKRAALTDDPGVAHERMDTAINLETEQEVPYSQFLLALVLGEGSWQLAAWPVGTEIEIVDGAARRRGGAPAIAGAVWLRAAEEPFQPPVIDFLTDHFGEPDRTPRPGNVTSYTFRPNGGTIRITADEPALTGALSAWWIHADTPERLAEFAALLLPWGTLRDTLRADTELARDVLNRLKGERPV